MHVSVIHGPNLNLLGKREPQIYGHATLAAIDEQIQQTARLLDLSVTIAQYNAEGAIIDAIHSAASQAEALIINPGAYSHYSHAIADAIAAVGIPTLEVHLSNIASREGFRRLSVTAPVCVGSIAGFGAQSYLLALHAAAALISS
ncbi:MAG: type II 3-dehydroquinate dehydratase, partial [Candidatus Eremiobacteraeota bacterium]|nr:type II 3-dehydroquinate dehydratase [Candidatus Eremiobacteraeota bacterium]